MKQTNKVKVNKKPNILNYKLHLQGLGAKLLFKNFYKCFVNLDAFICILLK